MKKNEVKVSYTNSKLGSQIPSVNLPTITCRADAPCQHDGCYAKKGNWNYETVKKSLENNLNVFKASPDNYFNSIINQINGLVIFKFFRWHSSGDIINAEYLKGMIKVAQAVPLTKFLCFTKKFAVVNKFIREGGQIPDNLKIVFSGWGPNFPIPNPFNFPATYVYSKKWDNSYIPELAIPCKGSCEKCQACWQLQRGQSVYFNKH